MAGKEDYAVFDYVKDLEKIHRQGNEQEMRCKLNTIFEQSGVSQYSLILSMVRELAFVTSSQKKSIAEMTLIEFRNWLKSKGQIPLERHTKNEAMFYLVTSGLRFIDHFKEIFQLDKGDDRDLLAAHLQYLYESKNDPKKAADVAVKLKLQDFIKAEDLILPLIAGDKFQVLDELLKDSSKLQNEYAEMLDRLCGLREGEIFDYIQNTKRLRIVDKTKFTQKTLCKISEKVIKKYDLDPVKFPQVFKEKNLKSVRYVLAKRYSAPPNEHAKWDGNIEAAVADDLWLQSKLILLIAYDHHDILGAAYWARRLNLPEDALPASVIKELEGNSSQITSGMPPLINFADDDYYASFDDDCYDGFMFSSDDEANDKTHDEIFRIPSKELNLSNAYWSWPLKDGDLKFVVTLANLQECIRSVFKPGNVIGFDSEWLPNYGRAGQKERISILQLAVKERVYIVDVIEFRETPEGQMLLKELFKQLFTSENTLRLGFGIDSDKNLIVENFPYAQEFLQEARHFQDLQDISKQIMKLPCVVKKLKTEKTANRKERGLSLLVQQCFGKPLDKTYQISNWERRPLCTEQLNYAALDALCIIKIYDVFEDLAAEFQIIVGKNSSSCSNRGDLPPPVHEKCVVAGPPRRPGQLRVVCDTMLQGLGKNLRSCGVDTIVLQNGEDHMKAVEHYYKDRRVILTKGKPFYQMRGCVPEDMCMYVPDGPIQIQLSAVFQRYGIQVTPSDIFSRCQICNCDVYSQIKQEYMKLAFWINANMEPDEAFMDKYQLHSLRGSTENSTGIDFKDVTLSSGVPLRCEFIPLNVFDKVDVFFVCTQCGKVYWEGSHFEKVMDQFANLIVNEDRNTIPLTAS